MVFESLWLLDDATLALDAGAYHSAALGCRACVELAGYTFLTMKWNDSGRGPWVYPGPLDLAGRPRPVAFDEIASAIRSKEILSSEALEGLSSIQQHGNIVAHVGPRLGRATEGWWLEMRKSQKKYGTGELPRVPTVWDVLTPSAVLADLRSAALISLELALAAYLGKDGLATRESGN